MGAAFRIRGRGYRRHHPAAPAKLPERILSPEEFGDSWSDELERSDEAVVAEYFRRKEKLHGLLGFIDLEVGGKRLRVNLGGPADRGITFAVPRNSLMHAIEFEAFDDLLIGNFMRTTLHGVASLYEPNFNFTVAKIADNGRAQTRAEVREYMKEYRRRAGFALTRRILFEQSIRAFMRLSKESPLYKAGRFVYRTLR